MATKEMNWTIEHNDLLLNFLFASITGKSKNNIKSFLSKKMVLVNGKVITQFDHPLQKGDFVSVMQGSIERSSSSDTIDIIYEDNDLIAVNKPNNLLTIATDKEKEKTLYHEVSAYVKKKSNKHKIYIVHRLDKETSGIVLFAKNERIKESLQENWNTLSVKREYEAIVEGKLKQKKGTIKTYLQEVGISKVISSSNPADGKLAITNYEVLSEKAKYSHVKIQIETGRKNQIRIHMKELGAPVLGDRKYGSKENVRRVYLHATILEIKHPFQNKTITFKTALPSSFRSVLL